MSDSKIINNSIWPNGMQIDSEGYAVFYPMGANKINIPSNSPHWPRGSKLKGSFVYDKDDKLVGFCDTKAMTAENEGIVVMPYEYIDAEFDSISNGDIQIHAPKATVKKASWNGSGEKVDIPDVDYKYKGCKNVDSIRKTDGNFIENDIVEGKWTELLSDLTSGFHMFNNTIGLNEFKSDLSSLTDSRWMFTTCSNLISFEADTSSLSDCEGMFYNCYKITNFKTDSKYITRASYMFSHCYDLTSFICDLSNLTQATSMFTGCSNLSIFAADDNGTIINLDSLKIGDEMFGGCSKITSFSSDLSSLTSGNFMFVNCSNLTSFTSILKSLTSGKFMFGGCKLLSHFESDLSSLTNGDIMFADCKLDAPSIKNIIDTINTVETGEITFGMGCNNNITDVNLFAQEVGYPDMTTLLAALQNKGWTVSAQFNGRPSSTFSLRKPDSLPVYAKLVEVIPTDEDSFYEYTSHDGSKFYNLDWFHETTGSTDTYTQFNSLEEAITTFNIKQIEK